MESSNFSVKKISKVERDSESSMENFYQEDSIDFEDIKIEPGRNSAPEFEFIKVEMEDFDPTAENSEAADFLGEIKTWTERSSENADSFSKISIEEEKMIEVPPSEDSRENSNICSICWSSFSTKNNLKQHIAIHTGERPHSCDVCSWKFRQKSGLKKHMRIHTGPKPYTCDICDSAYRSKSKLRSHILTHSDDKAYSCPICSSRFAVKSAFNQHMWIHAEEKPHSCKFCPSKFTQKGSLDRHMLIHSGVKPFACEICTAEFRQKSNLKSHMKIHDENRIYLRKPKARKKFIKVEIEDLNSKAENSPAADSRNEVQTSAARNCQDNEVFSKISIKEEIIEETPEIAKPYNCPICSSRFPAKTNLIQHLRVHTAKKSYSCSTCSAVFGTKSNLSQHRLIHAEEKPHACKFCPSRFTQKGNLDRHMLIHSGEKPFACEICAAEFRQKCNLKAHMKIHDEDRIYLGKPKAYKRVIKMPAIKKIVGHKSEVSVP